MAFLLMRYGLYESGNVLLRTRLCLSLWELSGCTTSTHYSWQMTQVAHRPGNLAFVFWGYLLYACLLMECRSINVLHPLREC
ncbi:hypothetical protein GQ600_19232 [Phytophthora cactorum]|nr:hypothetical protein GQ600_19232 [Phytophthora cactorum]